MKLPSNLFIYLLLFIGIGCDTTSNELFDSPLQPEWLYKMQGFSPNTIPKVVGNDLLIAGDLNITLLDRFTGEVKWQIPISEDISLQSDIFLTSGNKFYFTHLNQEKRISQLKSWNLSDGSPVWTQEFEETWDLINERYYAIGPTLVYGFGTQGHVLGFDKETGAVVFNVQLERTVLTQVYSNGRLYCGQGWAVGDGTQSGRITVLDATTGDSLWAYTNPASTGWFAEKILVNQDTVYAVSNDGIAVTLNAKTGAVLWEKVGYRSEGGEIIVGNTFYFNNAGEVNALNRSTGEHIWTTNMDAGYGNGNIVYKDGYLYHPHGEGLRVIDAETGEVVHVEWPPNGSYFWWVAVSDEYIYAQTNRDVIAYKGYQPPTE